MTDAAPLRSREALHRLVETWRDEGKQHEQKAAAYRLAGRPQQANRRQAEAEQCLRKASDLADALASLTEPPQKCRDGFCESANKGYGHQRCIHCGQEWEFNPPAPPTGARG